MPKPIPDGYTTVTTWIIGQDTAGLMAFLAAAFGVCAGDGAGVRGDLESR